ncbi:MAG: ATP synthase F0 subunit A [Candidatus Staskawiczbacteria bacterium RIFCSPHIGHO2_02_FULL_33_16]|uniref:ATP synthase subunit a n=1 Tax=Candidatus Staskawiczbacteria bacterium RIFCSPHIGHO2_02_FULL_33_16 TaxID=1802204 RepID=A0A1G2HX16_9BACT|nr:MAG: ATP synthase F0 subunit A [Candidatus Staskawiczbacteria bacterium RIFCSPHIGHO2_02_FULL_33_16]OGZ70371.1 MAG: ATP synthase F0 subunit A [Candidatus Staskawiczbacteria bacterium RIFCSPLOWO2_01_FULL_33_13]
MEEISLKAEKLLEINGFIITNSLFSTLVVSLFLMVVALIIYKKINIIPGKLQSVIEMGFLWLLDLMESMLGSMKKAEQYFPLVATIFIFIMASNLSGILPGVGSFIIDHEGKHIPLFRSPAADLNFTLAFAVISVITTNIIGMIAVGSFAHISKFINFKNPVVFFIGILELVSELAKIISLSFRLFGNVFAGEVLLIIVFFLAPYFIPLPFLFLEIFVGLIQAFVFAMLTLVSISLHTAGHEH